MLLERVVIRPDPRPAGVHDRDADHRHRLRGARPDHHDARLRHRDPHAAGAVQGRDRCELGGAGAHRRAAGRDRRHRACCAPCCTLLFRYSKLGVAMQAASQNQLAAYYMGIPVQRLNGLVWGLAAAVAAFAGLAARADHLRARQHGLHRPEGLSGGGGRRLRQPAGRDRRRPDHRRGRGAVGLLPARRLQGRRRLRGGAGDADGQAQRPVRRERCARRSEAPMRFIFKTDYDAGHPPVSSTAARCSGTALLLRRCCSPRPGCCPSTGWRSCTFILIYSHRRPRADAAGRLHRASSRSATRRSSASAPTPQAVLPARGCAVPAVAGRGGAAVGGGRHGRRPAGAAREGHLPGDRHARLRLHRRGGARALGERSPAATPACTSSRRDLFGWKLDTDASRSTSCASCSRCWPRSAILNLLRSPTGRAFVAIRDSEISAQSMGIHLARYKTLSFALSAALTGIGGALYAHKLRFISPDQFTIAAVDRPAADGGDRRPRLGARRVPRRDLPDHACRS